MESLKRIFLERISKGGSDREIAKSDFYSRASRIYLNKVEMREVLGELKKSNNVGLVNHGEKIVIKSPDYKNPLRPTKIRW